MLEAYRQHVAERAELNIPPVPLSPEQVASLIELLKAPPAGEAQALVELLTERVPPGVDEAAYVKAGFLSALAKGEDQCALIDREHAITLLGDMHGGYNIGTLVGLLDDSEYGASATESSRKPCWFSTPFTTLPSSRKRVVKTPSRCLKAGQPANGLPIVLMYPSPSK